MTFLTYRADLRVFSGYFLMGAVLLLSACNAPFQKTDIRDTSPTDRKPWFSATLSYEDRLMMRDYLLHDLYDGIAAIALMQARIDCRHDTRDALADRRSLNKGME